LYIFFRYSDAFNSKRNSKNSKVSTKNVQQHYFASAKPIPHIIFCRDASGNSGSHVADAGQQKWDGRDSLSESGNAHATASSDTEDWEKPENVGSILMTRQRRDEEYASWGAASASSFPLPAVPMIQQHESKASAASAASAASVASTSSASAASAASADKQVGKSVAAKTIPPEIAHAMVGVCR
jgi:hypothetical protein